MPGRLTEAAVVAAAAALVTGAVAAMVLSQPSERLFGMDIVGRHHDPFTVMEQFRRPLSASASTQLLTDLPGAFAARLWGVVAAYNWLILVTFPLSAAATYLLGRHLALSRAAATLAAMGYAFSPFHLAQSAYHVHIAQTQWIPLYLLALWRCLDDSSWRHIVFLAAAAVAVTLSNLYGGLIAAVMTPLAVGAYWWTSRRTGTRPLRRLAATVAGLVAIAVSGIGYLWHALSAGAIPATLVFPRSDLFRYSAKWWGYLVPPVASPLFGDLARDIWTRAGAREGLLEQQVSLGWGVVALGLVAIFGWSIDRRLPSRRFVPVLVALAAFGVICSLSPERTIGRFTFVRPAAPLFLVVPMFRSYARFGVVVQLMAVLLAGIGVDWLRRIGTRPALVLCVVLGALAMSEYAVLPSVMWRDVLPTKGHRWVMQRPGAVRALDCTVLDQESASVASLTHDRVVLLGGAIPNCTDARLPETLAANRFTHLLVRRRTAIGRWFTNRPRPDGLILAAQFKDAMIFEVTAPCPEIYTASMKGFYPAEHDDRREWRWMETTASWTVVNTTTRPLLATLTLELSAFRRARMEVMLDGRSVQAFVADPSWHVRQLGPFTLSPGHHDLVFRALDAPTGRREPAALEDQRQLTFALGEWTWAAPGDRP